MKNGRFARYGRFILKYSSAASGVIGGFFIFSMTLLVSVDVLGRYLFGKPTLVAVEMSAYMYVAIIFLGLAYTESISRHIQITTVTRHLPQNQQKVLAIVISITTIIFVGWLVWFSAGPAIQYFMQGAVSKTGTHTPLWIPVSLIPLGFFLFTFQLIASLIHKLSA